MPKKDDVVRKVLFELEKNGRLTPADVVDIARSPSSPLHRYFEWDDTEAAHQYRLNQARALIASQRFEVRSGKTVVLAPVFVHNPAAKREQGYVSSRSLKSDRKLAMEAILAEVKTAAAATERALGLASEYELRSYNELLRRALDYLARIN